MQDIKSELIRAFIVHWRSLCKNDAVPECEEYLDNILPQVAPFLLIYDFSDEDLTVRYQGTGVAQRWGQDLTGKSWFQFNRHLPKRLILANCRDCLMYRCGVLGESFFQTNLGQKIELESMMLPLSVKAGRPPRLANVSAALADAEQSGNARNSSGRRRMTWFDAGFGIPPHAMRRRR